MGDKSHNMCARHMREGMGERLLAKKNCYQTKLKGER